ncbi:PAS/PAC sensor signal transduction histidine kinase [Maribacter sedimenticola]|uniref:histidine kinase n=1 Tax=Maribacter sedimenticola TaxID=228956 RepID=A0ABY1SF79_9FLAO|nr:PAS domain-containing sensor histidine kinase [Maribacter sedimenticola]SNR40723.1 PAS/PAC sensor signal transduction histidine kinase [Maribacter sedimenticola]
MNVFEKDSNVFHLLSEGISEGIILVNTAQEIVATNSSAEEMFGYEKQELIGKSLECIIPKRYHHKHEGHFSSFMKKSEKRKMGHGRDLSGLRKNGEEFPVEAGLNPFTLYGNTYVMALVTDITERKNYTLNLEQTVQERTKQLTDALEKEKELNELKTRFLSLVSHEFKTPLSSILTSVTLLSKYTETGQQEKRDKHVDTIKSKVRQLDTILNDFLSVERLELGKVNYSIEDFPLSRVINEVVYDANMLLKTGQKIRYPDNIDEVVVTFDEKTLALALSNLLQNAIKYSPEETTIKIIFTIKDDYFTIQVADEGIGIPKEQQKYIFDRYFRAENALLNQGTGIGLNISKQHLENLGSTLSFVSQENVGSTFTIQIPRNIKSNTQ